MNVNQTEPAKVEVTQSAQDESETLPSYPRPLFAVAVVLICVVLLQVFTMVFSALLGMHYALVPAFIVGGIVPVFIAAKRLTPSARFSLRLLPVSARPVLFCICASFSFVILQYNVASLIEKLFPMPAWIQEFLIEITRVRSFSEFVRVASGVVVAASVAEELLFRGLLQGSFENRYGRWLGILFSSLLFALLHDPWRFVPVLFIGGLLGFVVSRGDSVYYGMVAHAVTNSTSVAGGNLFGIQSGTEISLPWTFVALMVALFVVSIFGFIRTAGKDVRLTSSTPLPGKSSHSSAE